jgi:hypothetical protein
VSKAFHTVAAAVAGALLGAGLMLVRGVSAERETQPVPVVAAPVAPSLLEEVSERVRRDYVAGVEPGQLDRAALDGILSSPDLHPAFLDAEE